MIAMVYSKLLDYKTVAKTKITCLTYMQVRKIEKTPISQTIKLIRCMKQKY